MTIISAEDTLRSSFAFRKALLALRLYKSGSAQLDRTAAGQKMRWEELPQQGSKPLARSSHTLTACGSRVYLFGGEHEPR